MFTQQSRVGWWVIGLSSVVIAIATLTPIPHAEASVTATPLGCLVCGPLGTVDVVLNTLLFIPLGFGLGLGSRSLKRAALVGFAASFVIEALQFTVIAGRDAGVSDILTNTFGAVLGWVLARHWRRLLFPPPTLAWTLLLTWSAVVAGILTGTALLLQPSGLSGPWFGIVSPKWPDYGVFHGQVLEVSLAGKPVPADSLPHWQPQRAGFLAGDPILLRFIRGRSSEPRRLTPIVELAASHQLVAAFAQRGEDLEFRVRLRASDVRLAAPAMRLNAIMAGQASDTVCVWGGVRRGRLYAGAVADGQMRKWELPLRVALGWTLISPLDLALGNEVAFFSVVWVLVLVLPLAYYAAWIGKPWMGLVLVLGITIVGLAVVPALVGLPTAAATDYAGAVGGILLGIRAGFHGRWQFGRPRATRAGGPPV